MLLRGFLIYLGLFWSAYAAWIFMAPGELLGIAGMQASNSTAVTEIRAMYGGLQLALGLFTLAALVRPSLLDHALWMNAVLTAGLGIARLAGGFIDDSWSGYTLGALVFEFSTALICTLVIRSRANR